jgi:hypothetical protein
MKFILSFLFVVIFNYSYSQVTQLNPSKIQTVGKINIYDYDGQKCDYDPWKCDWTASLSYGVLDNRRIYTYKYRVKFGALGKKKKEVIREVKFFATEAEIDFLYNQIKEWWKDNGRNKPDRIFFKLGENTLEVQIRSDISSVYDKLYFIFDKTVDPSENWVTNGFLFDACKLEDLFGKKTEKYHCLNSWR